MGRRRPALAICGAMLFAGVGCDSTKGSGDGGSAVSAATTDAATDAATAAAKDAATAAAKDSATANAAAAAVGKVCEPGVDFMACTSDGTVLECQPANRKCHYDPPDFEHPICEAPDAQPEWDEWEYEGEGSMECGCESEEDGTMTVGCGIPGFVGLDRAGRARKARTLRSMC